MSRERKGERMFGFEGPSVAFVSGSFLALDRDLNVFFQIHSTSLEIHMFFFIYILCQQTGKYHCSVHTCICKRMIMEFMPVCSGRTYIHNYIRTDYLHPYVHICKNNYTCPCARTHTVSKTKENEQTE